MKREQQIILASLGLGLLAWGGDAILGALFFPERSFWDVLILAVPPHELVSRLATLALFLALGVFVTRLIGGQRQVDEAVRKSEARYRTLFEQANDAIFLETAHTEIVDVNSRASELTGYSRDELLTMRTTQDLQPPEYHGRPMNTGPRFETEVLHRNGRRIPVEITVAPVTEGDTVLYLDIVRDISERKQAETAARKVQQQLQDMFDNTPASVYVKDLDGRYIFVNRMFCERTGKTDQDLLGKTAPEAFPDFYQEPWTEAERQTLEGTEITHEEIGRTTGQTYLSTKFLLWDADGNPYALCSSSTDITALKQAEATLRESEEKYRQLFELESDALFLIDNEAGHILEANPAAAALYGYSRAELLQMKNTDLSAEPDETRRATQESATHVPVRYHRRKDGTVITVEITASHLMWRGRPAHIAAIRDVTERQAAEEALRESEEKYRLVSENIPVAVYSALPDEHSTSLFISGQIEELTGYTGQEFLDDPALWSSRLHPEDRERVWAAIEDHRRQRTTLDVEYRFITRDSTIRWIRDKATPALDEDNQLVRIDGFLEDVSERKRAEEAEREQRALAEALRGTAAALSGTLSLGEVFDRILDSLGRVVPHGAANIMLVEEGVARIVGRRGYVERGLDEAALAIRYPVGDTPNLAHMAASGQGMILADAQQYAGWVLSEGTRWIRAYVGAPIRLEGQVIGFLNLDNATPGSYTPAHIERLQAFADQAAIAIRNAQLYEAEQRRRHVAETLRQATAVINSTLELDEVLDLILRQLREVIAYDTAAVQRIENTHLVIEAAQGFPRGEKVVGLKFPIEPKFPNMRVITEERPLAIEDVVQEYPHFQDEAATYESGHIRSWLGVPLRARDRVIGMITLDRTTVRPYTDEDVELATAFANQAALAIENAQLHRSTRERAIRLELVGHVGQRATAILDRDELLQQAVGLIAATFGYYYTSILLVEGNDLVLRATNLPDLKPMEGRLRLRIGAEGITGWVAATGQPLLVPDVSQDARYVFYAEADRLTCSELALPIKHRGQVLGVLNVESETLAAFSEADAAMLQTIADQLAIAIHNARLFEQVQRRATELEVLRQVTLDITTQLDLEALLTTLAESALRLLGVEAGGIYFYRPEPDELEWVVSIGPGMVPPGAKLRRGEGVSGRVWETGEPLIVEDYLSWQGRAAQYDGYDFHAVLGVPIRWGDEFLGVINATGVGNATRVFSEDDTHLLSLFADQAAIAIHNARLYKSEREQRLLAETLREVTLALTAHTDPTAVLGEVVRQAKRFVPYSAANIALLEDGMLRIAHMERYPEQIAREVTIPARRWDVLPLDREAIQSRQPVVVPDTHADPRWTKLGGTTWRSYLVVPIHVRERVVGLLRLNGEQPNQFSAEDVRRLSPLANAAAVALENARLHEAERAQRVLAEALRDIAATLNSSLDLDAVLDGILANVGRVVPHDAANVMLIEAGSANVVRGRGYADRGTEAAVLAIRYPVAKTPNLRQMFETGQPLVIGDVQAYPGWIDEPFTRWMRSYIGVPIRLEGEVIGFLNLDSGTPDFFTEVHADRLQVFADQAAVAIENAWLYEQTRQELGERMRMADALRESEHFANTVISSVHEGVVVLDRDLCFRVWNPFMEDLTGVAADEVVDRQPPEIFPYVIEQDEAFPVERALAGETVQSPDTWYHVPQTGKAGWITGTYGPHVSADGAIIGVVATIHDITERKRAEESEREQRVLAEALSSTTAALTSTLDSQEVMSRILANVGRVVPHDAANIMIIEGDRARVAYWQGYPADAEATFRKQRIALDVATLDMMIATGLPYLAVDTAADPNWEAFPESAWVRSYIGAPIRSQGQAIGFLNLNSARPGFFTAAHTGRLQLFADQAAVALENAQLYEALSNYATEITTLYRATSFLFTSLLLSDNLHDLGHEIAQAVVNEFGKVACGVILADWEGQTLEWLAQAGESLAGGGPPGDAALLPLAGAGLVRQAISAGQMVYVPDMAAQPDAPHARSRLIMPLQTPRGVIGALDLQSGEADAFNEQEQLTMRAFAERAAATIENMRLYEEVRRYAAELEQRVIERTAELERERAQLRAILDSMGEGVVYAEDATARYVNQALIDMTGYEADELIGQFIGMLKGDAQATRELVRVDDRSLNGHSVWREEIRLQRKDGSAFDAALTITLLDEPQARPIREVTLIRDISQDKALQAKKDRFIANASHELRTPLSNVTMRLYLLRKQPQRMEEHLHVLDRVTVRMKRLIEDLLDLSRFDRGLIRLDPQPCVLQDLAAEVVALQEVQAAEKSIRLTSELPAAPLHALIDPQRMMQVITNLVVNAINYTPTGGVVVVRLFAENGHAVIQVTDTGVGIAPDVIENIFEPFFRADESGVAGTGLGLSIAREIVERHGGAIIVESEVGRGSTFSIRLELLGD